MEVLMDYHLLFIVISFCLLFMTILFLFVNNTKEKTIGAVLMSAINYIICMINSFAFFAVGIIGVDTTGTASITVYHDMFPFYAVFFMLYWVNIVFIFYCWWLWVRDPWNINKEGSSQITTEL